MAKKKRSSPPPDEEPQRKGFFGRLFGGPSEDELRARESKRHRFNFAFDEHLRVGQRIEDLGRERDDHRSKCTACLTGNPCATGRRKRSEIDALLEKYKELEKIITENG